MDHPTLRPFTMELRPTNTRVDIKPKANGIYFPLSSIPFCRDSVITGLLRRQHPLNPEDGLPFFLSSVIKFYTYT